MNATYVLGLLISTLFTVAAVTAKPLPDTTDKSAKLTRIRASDIAGWSSDNNTSLVITTKRRERFLVELDRSCFNLRHGSRDNALLTDSAWIDRHSGIRLLDRFTLENQFLHGSNNNFFQAVNVLSAYCPIKEITALGRAEKRKS